MSNESRQKMNERRKKVYVLDTTVLIDNPHLPYELVDGDVVIPVVVLRELDGLKNSDDLRVARGAREVSRFLDRVGSYGDLGEGVKLSTGPVVRLYRGFEAVDLLASEGDNRVLGCALSVKLSEGGRVCVVTTDINMVVAARSLFLGVMHPYGGAVGANEGLTVSGYGKSLPSFLLNESGNVGGFVSQVGFRRFHVSAIRVAIWLFWVGIMIGIGSYLFPSFTSRYSLIFSFAGGFCLLFAVGLLMVSLFVRDGWDVGIDSVWFNPSWRHLDGNVWHRGDRGS